jgi:hypothetical protein
MNKTELTSEELISFRGALGVFLLLLAGLALMGTFYYGYLIIGGAGGLLFFSALAAILFGGEGPSAFFHHLAVGLRFWARNIQP